MFGGTEQRLPLYPGRGRGDEASDADADAPASPRPSERTPSRAALRRELWRDNPQQSVEEHQEAARAPLAQPSHPPHPCHRPPPAPPQRASPHDPPAAWVPGEVFKFDSFDRDRYLPRPCGEGAAQVPRSQSHFYLPPPVPVPTSQAALPLPFYAGGAHPFPSSGPGARQLLPEDPGEDVFTPAGGRSPRSSLSSPQVSVESPRICFSPLKIKDSIEEEDETGLVMHR